MTPPISFELVKKPFVQTLYGTHIRYIYTYRMCEQHTYWRDGASIAVVFIFVASLLSRLLDDGPAIDGTRRER